MSKEDLYRAFHCPGCRAPFTPVESHMPSAPGSDEGLHCFKCGATWGWWRPYRREGKVIPYGKPTVWMWLRDFLKRGMV